MALIQPFSALRPRPDLAAQICELPYDVMSSAEARALAAGNPLSFLHVSKPEIDLPDEISPYDPVVYLKGKENFLALKSQGALQQEARPCFYLYRQVMGSHRQTGLVAVTSCEEYGQGLIKKHELTRPDKEADRTRHIEVLEAQTGPAFLTFRNRPSLSNLFESLTATPPEVDFVAKDGVRHSAWVVSEPEPRHNLRAEFSQVPCLYIADGHHRTAAAYRIYQARNRKGESASFLSVIFPHDQMQILPYNRVLKDLNGFSSSQLLDKLAGVCKVQRQGTGQPSGKHELSLYLDGQWFSLKFHPNLTTGAGLVDRLDVSLLQEKVLAPIFGIQDPRTSDRINFVGGIRGTAELEQMVNRKEGACAFSLFPTSIEELMAIADADGIMPPKSTWFEPKLRDGMFCHLLS